MKKSYLSFAAGMLTGVMLFGGGTAYAAGVMAEHTFQTVYVDGVPVRMETCNVNNTNYVKLRDIGQAVGFNVYWDGRSIQIDSDAAYTGEAPSQPEITPPASSMTDYSTQANPAIFTNDLTREVYNAVRNTIINREAILAGKQEPINMGTGIKRYGSLDNALAAIGRYPIYELRSQPDGYICNVRYPESNNAAANHTQSFVNGLSGLNQREQVKEITWYVADRLTYSATVVSPSKVLASDNVLSGNCMSYAHSFAFLCNRAGIPCILVSSKVHQWNMVYVDGQWWDVDVTASDAVDPPIRSQSKVLKPVSERFGSDFTDQDPDATHFAQELLVPGSTK